MSWGAPSGADDWGTAEPVQVVEVHADTGGGYGEQVHEAGDGEVGAGGNDGTCFNCGQQGHMKSDCPEPRQGGENSGKCYNCGEEGHNKADCTNPAVARVFDGECRLCQQVGHRAADCPDAGPKICKNCGQEGHDVGECDNTRMIDRSRVADVAPEVAWAELAAAAEDKDMDDVKEALERYFKAIPSMTYVELEKAFRHQGVGIFIIATEREILDTYTIMDLQGNLGKKYTISYRFSDKPKRPKEKEGWPSDAAENLERLEDAGEPVDRHMPRCNNCDVVGHTSRSCPEEKVERTDRAEVKCFNCDEVGHRVRDCPNPRPDKFACRNCGESGHGSKECPEPQKDRPDMECRKCNQMGHSSRNCPQGGGGGSWACRNCGQEGHKAAECVNEHIDICRNCDAHGHVSRDCPLPRDYSRVKCQNCQQMGHTKVRCKEPLVVEEDTAGDGGAGYGDGGTAAIEAYDANAGGGDGW